MMIGMIRLAVPAAAALVALSTPVHAQPQPPSGEFEYQQPLVSNIGTPRQGKYIQPLPRPQIFEWMDERLPQIYVRDIVQDTQGFIWIGTQGGLARYDGHDVRTVLADADAKLSLSSSYVTVLEIGADGTVWIGTGEAGINVYDPETDTIKHYREGPQDGALGSSGINVLYRDPDGVMWVGTSDGILDRYDAATDEFQHIRVFEELETGISVIADAGNGLQWIGTEDAGLFKFDPSSSEIVAHYLAGDEATNTSSNSIRDVFVDSEERGEVVWVGTAAGLNRLDPATGNFERFGSDPNDQTTLSDERITRIMRDTEGILWVGTEHGLNRMESDSKRFVQYARTTRAPVNTAAYPVFINSLYEDQSGLIWAGTRSGAIKVDKMRMRFQPHYNLTGTSEVTAFVDGEPGTFWAGTYTTGLQKYDYNVGRMVGYSYLGDLDSPDVIHLNEWIMALYRDRNGIIYLSGPGLGLVKFNPETEAYKQFLFNPETQEGPTVDTIHAITEDAEGYIWLATWGGGLNRFDPRWETFVEFRDEKSGSSLSSDYLYSLTWDTQNPSVLWIGTARGGLNRFDTSDQSTTLYSLTPKNSTIAGYDSIYTAYQDDAGILWLGTDGGGMVRFDPSTKEKRYFTEEDGHKGKTVYGILPDNQGRLWISSASNGISVYDPRSESIFTYTSAHGLATDDHMQNCHYRSRSGMLFFGGGSGAGYSSGFSMFDPEEIVPDRHPPKVALTSFQIFDTEVDLEQPIWTQPQLALGYGDSVFSFEFSALAYASGDSSVYSYKMDGLHDWLTSNRRFVTYTNIAGGDYVFRVKAANRQGVWGDEAITVAIHVDPPPWRSWWAYTIYGLILISIILAYIRYQSRRVKSLQQTARLEAMERDLELTGAVQTGFLPSVNAIENSDFRLFGFYRPADQASGDWWWYEESEHKLTILVGDVTGHGPGPAMVTAAAATAFRIQARHRDMDLAERLEICNSEVLRVGGGQYNMTMSAIEVDGRTGRFNFYSAGGLPILRIRYDGRPRALPCTGSPLGSEQFDLGKVEGRMNPGERMLLYTDGIPEMPLAQGRLLGMRRFSMICESTGGLALDEAAQKIVLVSDSLRQNAPQYDDWTFALIEWNGTAQAAQMADETNTRDSAATGWTAAGSTSGQPDGWGRPSQIDRWLDARQNAPKKDDEDKS